LTPHARLQLGLGKVRVRRLPQHAQRKICRTAQPPAARSGRDDDGSGRPGGPAKIHDAPPQAGQPLLCGDGSSTDARARLLLLGLQLLLRLQKRALIRSFAQAIRGGAQLRLHRCYLRRLPL